MPILASDESTIEAGNTTHDRGRAAWRPAADTVTVRGEQAVDLGSAGLGHGPQPGIIPVGKRCLHRKRMPAVDGAPLNDSLAIPPETLRDFCRRWQIVELALFGSVLRDDFGPDSDVDVLVSFAEGAGHSLFELDDMESELKEIFGREVDFVTRRGIESSPNYLRRNAILGSAETIYGS